MCVLMSRLSAGNGKLSRYFQQKEISYRDFDAYKILE